jgi:hypothetical protein
MQDIESRLTAKNIRQDDFRAICSILLSKGLLTRADGGDTLRLYDIASRCEEELQDYITFAFPVVLIHTLRPPHFRLVPSHHRDPGLADPDEELETRREIRQSVVQALAASLLALRMLYDEQLVEKKMDSAGRISIKLTELALFMNTTLGILLPTTKTDQRALFLKLKKHGAIDVRIDALNDEDAVVVIRPEILTLVLDQNVRTAQTLAEQRRQSGEPQTEDDDGSSVASAEIIPLDRGDRSSFPLHGSSKS